MLTFFRRIRKGLLGDGATSKYLIYAIGEIALVVIGILIALQINNWRSYKNDRKKEIYHLHQMFKNLERNVHMIHEGMIWEQDVVRSSHIILNLIEDRIPYYDSLDYVFHSSRAFSDPSVSSSAYVELRNDGFSLIENEVLRQEIIELFEVTYPKMVNNIDQGRNVIIYPSVQPFYYENFESKSRVQLRPNNFGSLLEDQKYLNILKQNKNLASWFLEMKANCIDETQRVLQLIKEELHGADLR